MMPPGAGDCSLNMIEIQRFHDIVEGSAADCFDRALNRLLAANHDDGRIRAGLMNMRQQIQTADPAHVYVADDNIKFAFTKHSDRVFCRRYIGAAVIPTKQLNEQTSDLLIIIDDQKARFLPVGLHFLIISGTWRSSRTARTLHASVSAVNGF